MPTREDDEDDDEFVKFLRDFVDKFHDPIKLWLEEMAASGKRRTKEMKWIMFFLAGLVTGTGILTYLRAISGEAFTFLVGSVLMYLFDLVRPRLRVGA